MTTPGLWAAALGLAQQSPAAAPPPFDRSMWVALSTQPTWLLVVVAGVLVLAVGLSARAVQNAPRRTQGMLIGLRLLCALALFVFVLEPGRLQQATTKRPNTVVLALDASTSMLEDDGTGQSRWERAKTAAQGLAADIEGREGGFSVRRVRFDESAQSVGRAALDEATPQGARTVLQSALEAAAAVRPAPLGGVVLFTDGADTAGPRGVDEARRTLLNTIDAPVHTVLLGDESTRQDLAVADVDADEFAFVRNPFKLRVRLTHPGYNGALVPLTLFFDGKVERLQQVQLSTDGETTVELEFEPKTPGQHVLSVEAAPQTGERDLDNNRFDKTLKVIRDRIRVLQVAGRPSWDERFVRRLLKENPSVDLISFFILRTPTDEARAANHELSLIPFPTRELFTEQLHTFDVIVLQNFDYAPYQMGQYLRNIRDFVTEAGGGLLMVGGDLSFAEGDYANTPVAEVLPVTLPTGHGHLDTESFRPTLTPAGQNHPVTRLLELGFGENPYLALPPLEGVNLVTGLMPGAQTLLAHPYLNAGGEAQPVVAVREVGNGRSMAVLTDTTWFWSLPHVGQGGRGDVHRRVFANALRWLIRDPDLSRVQVQPAKDTFFEGEPVLLDVRTVDAQYKPLGGARVDVELRPLTAGRPTRKVSGKTQPDGAWRLQLDDLPPGAYHVRAEGQADAQSLGYDTGALVVKNGALEARFDRPERAAVQAFADATSGDVVAADAATRLRFVDHDVRTVHRQQTEPLWPKPLPLILAVLLFAAEWWLRRRAGFA